MPSKPVPAPAQARLAAALRRMKELQDTGTVVFRSADLGRSEREALLRAGFLRAVVKGWYLASRPGDAAGATTPWFAAMRDFIGGYCDARFGDNWYASPAYSLHMHAGTTVLPKQVIVHTASGKNTVLDLPGECSLLDYRAPDFPISRRIEKVRGVRVLPVATALIRVPETFFVTAAADTQILLAQIPDTSEINRELLAGGHSVVAGRLVGAFRAVGRGELADDILGTMRSAGYSVVETNPFRSTVPVLTRSRAHSPYVLRLQLMWTQMRREVVNHFPVAPGLPVDHAAYMEAVDEGYKSDAYHSLSIEGYRVTEELVERVANGNWNPEQHARDADARNAMAAHGYWRAFESVKESLRRILAGKNAGAVVRADHGTWFRALFAPSVAAGILTPADLAGYRSGAVYIKNAAHVPPPHDAVRDMMPALFDLLAEEEHPAVRAVLGHVCFVFVHPYMDGNGRTGRFLMNAMLASGGFPWTVIRVEWRDQYFEALDAASARGDIGPLARFLAAAVSGRTPLGASGDLP